MVKWYIPGPVELSPRVMQAGGRQIIGHRSEEFKTLFADSVSKAQQIFLTKQPIFLMSCSGTGAIDACLQNLISPTDKVLAFENGDFGRRWGEACKIYSPNTIHHKTDWTKGIHADAAKALIEEHSPNWVVLVHNDTSVAGMNPVKEIAAAAKAAGAGIIVDSVSGLAGEELRFDDWELDACVSSGQKCIGAPSGLSLVALSANAMEVVRKNPPRSWYFDFKKYEKSAAKNETPSTPALPGFFQLNAALSEVVEEGVEARWRRHHALAEFTRKNVEDLGYSLFMEEGYQSETVTAFNSAKVPETRKALKAAGFVVARGMGDYQEKIMRIAHMANITTQGLSELFDALAKAKKTVGE